MSKTSIEWTDDNWNPVRGCSMAPGSELGGCLNCYAARQAARNLPGHRSPTTGNAFAILTDNGPRWTGKVELIESKLLEPLHWKKPRRVFVNSMSDLFHEDLPDESIDRVFAVMMDTPHITYQILTKRAKNMRRVVSEMYGRYAAHWPSWPLPNIWLGVSVENQPTADERIPELLRTPAALRFVSYEPALSEVDFTHLQPNREVEIDCLKGTHGVLRPHGGMNTRLDWGIIGGESGPSARPFRIEWLRSTIRQFDDASVPLFVKQLGSNPVCSLRTISPIFASRRGWSVQRGSGGKEWPLKFKDSKGGDPEEWPSEFKVRQFPPSGGVRKMIQPTS